MKKHLLTFCLMFVAYVSLAFDYNSIYSWMVFTPTYSFVNNKLDMNNNLGGSSNGLNAIVQDNNGITYFATTGQGLRMFDGKKLSQVKVPKESYANSSDVLCMAVDSKNTLWLGTAEGLVKYDGATWVNIDKTSTQLQAITGIAITGTDKVYITGQVPYGPQLDQFRGGGISFFNGQGWNTFNKSNSSIPDDSLTNLLVDANNHLWVIPGMQDAGVAKFDGKNWKVFNTSNTPMPTNNVRGIATNSSGKIWLATTKGVVTFDGTDWKSLAFANGFDSKRLTQFTATTGSIDISTITVEPNGAVWLGTHSNGVFCLRGKTFKIFNRENSLLSRNNVLQILVDKDHKKWFVTGDYNARWGVYYLGNKRTTPFTVSGGEVTVLKESDKLYDPKWDYIDSTSTDLRLGTTWSIGEDKEGNIWMPNNVDGLVKYTKEGARSIFRNGGEFGSAFNKMFIAPDDKIYLNTDISGVKMFDHGTFSDFAKWPNMGGVSDMAIDKDGNFWAAGTGGLSMRKGDDWETFNKRKGDLPSIIIYSVFKDSKGNLWAGTAKGLVKKTDSAFQVWRKGDVEFPSDDITFVTEAPDGKMWFGTKAGISILDGTTWTHISKIESPKISKPTINDISFDKNGKAWIATNEDALLTYDGKTWAQYNTKNGGTIPDRVMAVKVASDGRVYVAAQINEWASSDFMLPSSSPSDMMQNDLIKKVKSSDPKKIIAIITP